MFVNVGKRVKIPVIGIRQAFNVGEVEGNPLALQGIRVGSFELFVGNEEVGAVVNALHGEWEEYELGVAFVLDLRKDLDASLNAPDRWRDKDGVKLSVFKLDSTFPSLL